MPLMPYPASPKFIQIEGIWWLIYVINHLHRVKMRFQAT